MPTIRQYFYKSVKNIILIAVAIVVAFLLALFIAWILPTNGRDLRMFFWFFYMKEIGLGILIFTTIFFLYKSYKIYKTEKPFRMELLKMTPSVIIWAVAFLCSSTYLYNLFHETDCQQYSYNNKLNGGPKEIGGKTYIFNVCGGVHDSHFLGDGLDRVQLTITDEQGAVLAKRHYKIMWGDTLGHQPLLINRNSISYFDDTNSYAEQRTITMPPTILDWIGARVPLLN